MTAGARRKTDDFSEAEDRGTLKIDTPEEFERRATDKFAKLEHSTLDKLNVLKSDATKLTKLQHINDRQWSDPYALSQKLRKAFRDEKNHIKKSEALADKIGVSFKILPGTAEDSEATKLIEFESGEKALMTQRLKEIKSGDLFAAVKNTTNSQRQQSRGSRSSGLVIPTGGGRSGVTGGRGGVGGLSKTSARTAAGAISDKEQTLRSLTSVVKANTQLQVDPFLKAGGSASPKATSVLISNPKLNQASKLPLVAYGDDDDEDEN